MSIFWRKMSFYLPFQLHFDGNPSQCVTSSTLAPPPSLIKETFEMYIVKCFSHVCPFYCVYLSWSNLCFSFIIVLLFLSCIGRIFSQLIHTISVVDRDEPQSGHRFYFTLAPEASSNRHFTLWDVKGENAKGPTCGHIGKVKYVQYRINEHNTLLSRNPFSPF